MKLNEIIRSVTWTRLKKKIHELFPESEASMKYAGQSSLEWR